MLGLVVEHGLDVALEEGRLLVDYLQPQEVAGIALADQADGLPVLEVGGQFGQFVVAVGKRGNGVEIPKDVLYLIHRCITEDHKELLSVFHEDDRIAVENCLVGLDVPELSTFESIRAQVELF